MGRPRASPIAACHACMPTGSPAERNFLRLCSPSPKWWYQYPKKPGSYHCGGDCSAPIHALPPTPAGFQVLPPGWPAPRLQQPAP